MPEPDSPTMPTRLALGDGDVDVLHRAHDAAAGGELDGEVVDVEQRDARSWLASGAPLRIDDVAQAVAEQVEAEHRDHQRERPGKNAIHHSPETMKAAPSATMMPHSAVGGRTPSPMKDRPAALRMA